MPNDHAASALGTSPHQSQAGILDRLIFAAAARAFDKLRYGQLTITLPAGAATVIGGRQIGRDAACRVVRHRGLWKAVRRGKLGFAEAYMDGDVEVDDLQELFHYFIDNETALGSSAGWLLRTGSADHRYHESRENTREGSRRNIAAHYDLGNDFYRHWLDSGMSYSSAIFEEPGATLEQAQARKHERILQALDLQAGHDLLEIGCGWGSVMEAAAARGARVKGITISAEQLEWTTQRLARAGLSEQTQVVFEDYRDTRGEFDRIVSIEMIEAVGEAHWATYFRVLSDRLRSGGSGILQAITIPEKDFEGYRTTPDFIQRYIFPGGMLPTVEAMRAHAEAAGLTFTIVQPFGRSYARTLREWSMRFNAAWPKIANGVFDERFRRMWNYYLDYCSVAFERDCIDVGLYRVVKR